MEIFQRFSFLPDRLTPDLSRFMRDSATPLYFVARWTGVEFALLVLKLNL
jgi:GGDEF domain-containing protein